MSISRHRFCLFCGGLPEVPSEKEAAGIGNLCLRRRARCGMIEKVQYGEVYAMRCYLGLDNGGTNTKAALFTPDGTQIAVESIATAALTPAPGFVERDMEDMWRDNCAVIRCVLEKSGQSVRHRKSAPTPPLQTCRRWSRRYTRGTDS